MLGIAMAIALAATALIGVVSASATVLCKENAKTCAAGGNYASGSAIEASLKSGTNLTLKSGILPTVTCTSSSLSGKTTANFGTGLPLEVSAASVGECTKATGSEAVNLPYVGSLERTTGGNGTVALTSSGKGIPTLKMTKPFGLNATCYFGASPLNLALTGGNPASLTVEATLAKQSGSGGICPAEAVLSASYEVTSPKPAFATAGALVNQTVFCKTSGSVCPSSNSVYPKNTVVESSGENAEFNWGYGGWSCKGVSTSLENTSEAGSPLSTLSHAMAFSSCGPGVGCESVEATLPIAGSLQATSGGNGTLKTSFEITLSKCFMLMTCKYAAINQEIAVTGGNGNATLHMEKLEMTKQVGSSTNCSSTLTLSAFYTVKSPSAFWVSKAES
jgi:hypothetical protein